MDDAYFFFEREKLGRTITDKSISSFLISLFIEKEKKLFGTTRKDWEEVSEAKRLHYSFVGYYRQEECDKRIESLSQPTSTTASIREATVNEHNVSQPSSSIDAKAVGDQICMDSLCFSAFIKKEYKKEKDKYSQMSFIQQYIELRSKWDLLSADDKVKFSPSKSS